VAKKGTSLFLLLSTNGNLANQKLLILSRNLPKKSEKFAQFSKNWPQKQTQILSKHFSPKIHSIGLFI